MGRPGRNIGELDRLLRIGIGTAMVMMAIFGPLDLWGFLGIYPLVTGLTGRDPLYPLLGLSTWRPPVTPDPGAEAPPPGAG